MGVLFHVSQLVIYVVFLILIINALQYYDKREENTSFYLRNLILAQIIQFAAFILGIFELLITSNGISDLITGFTNGEPMTWGYYIWALGFFVCFLMLYYNSQLFEDLKTLKFGKNKSETNSSTD